MNVPEAHPYECNKIMPQLLSRIQKLETLVISLMIERITKIGLNRDHSHLASKEIKSDNEDFSTRIRLSPEEAEYNYSSVLSQSAVTTEGIITSKKRNRKAKKKQNRRTSKGNEEAEIEPSLWAFPNQVYMAHQQTMPICLTMITPVGQKMNRQIVKSVKTSSYQVQYLQLRRRNATWLHKCGCEDQK